MLQTMPAPSRRTRKLIDEVATVLTANLDESANVVTTTIHENVGRLSDELFSATRESTRANLGLINAIVVENEPPSTLSPPLEAITYARGCVREGLSMDNLADAYRHGERAYARLWLDELQSRAKDAAELAEAMGFVSDYLFAYIQEIVKPLGEVYSAEHERWMRSGVAARSDEVRSILAGARVDETEASSRLRYRLEGRHVGFVLWREDGDADTMVTSDELVSPDMERIAAQAAAALGSTNMLAVPIGHHYAAWVAVTDAPEPFELPLGRSGIRMSVGRMGRGVEGFRRTHQEALRARRVSDLANRSQARLVTFDEYALDALLTSDLSEARRFVAHELGDLMDSSDGSMRLRSTLEVFLHEESSYVRAARRLNIHENTVAYRVKRAEELLGRRTSSHQLELRTALRLARFVTDNSPV